MTTLRPCLSDISDGILIGVVGLNSAPAVSQAILSLFQTAGKKINDVCCVDLRRKSSTLWKLFTTHASVWVDGERIDISCSSECPRDGLLIYRLRKQRDALLAMLNGAETKTGFPYVSIQGKRVVLFGDFSVFPVVFFSALEKIFFANGAKEVEFIKVA